MPAPKRPKTLFPYVPAVTTERWKRIVENPRTIYGPKIRIVDKGDHYESERVYDSASALMQTFSMIVLKEIYYVRVIHEHRVALQDAIMQELQL